MSVAAKIKFVQGATTPPAGQALVAVVGVAVQAANDNNSFVASWQWEITSVPTGSAVPTGIVATGNATTYTFTPDLVGGYLVRLTVTDFFGVTAVTELAVMITENVDYGRYIAPFSAQAPALNIGGQVEGWGLFMRAYLKLLERIRDWGSALPTNGQVPTWNASAKRWDPGTGGGGLPVASAPAQVLVSDSLNDPQWRTVTGDVTIGSTGITAIATGVIVNTDVNASAAIAGTKIDPAFGSQNVSTTGTLGAGNTTWTSGSVLKQPDSGSFIALSGDYRVGKAWALRGRHNSDAADTSLAVFAAISGTLTFGDASLLTSIKLNAAAAGDMRVNVPIIGDGTAWGSNNATTTQAMADANQTAAAAVYQGTTIKLTGANSADRNLTLPTATDPQGYGKWIRNTCTGLFSVIVKCAAGTTVAVVNGTKVFVWIDLDGVTVLTTAAT